jgi:hypothetical protein
VDSLGVGVSSLGICHYRMNNDGTIQFPPTDCQTALSEIPSGESFGAFGLYLPPSGEFCIRCSKAPLQITALRQCMRTQLIMAVRSAR